MNIGLCVDSSCLSEVGIDGIRATSVGEMRNNTQLHVYTFYRRLSIKPFMIDLFNKAVVLLYE